MRDLAWRRFSSPHSLRGGVYPREPVLAGVLRACSAQVAYMPWPLPELYGGGSGGGGSAAAMAMASNPIPRSELSHLRQLFPQTFEAARRCPQVRSDSKRWYGCRRRILTIIRMFLCSLPTSLSFFLYILKFLLYILS